MSIVSFYTCLYIEASPVTGRIQPHMQFVFKNAWSCAATLRVFMAWCLIHFVYCLFNDAVSISEYTASNHTVISELERYLSEGVVNQFEVLSQQLYEGTEECHENPVTISVFRIAVEPGTTLHCDCRLWCLLSAADVM
jgi:hypothetical protein